MEPIHKPRGTYADYLSGDYSNKVFVFELTKKNPEGGVVRSKETGKTVQFPLAYPIPLIGTVFFKYAANKEYPKGKIAPRKIRLANGEKSIYVDEQTPDDVAFPKQKIYANFVKGRYQIDGNESTLLDFFFNWDINETKEGRDIKKTPLFRLVDSTVISKKAREDHKLKFDVENWCWNADWNTKIQPLASMIFTYEQMMQDAGDIRHNLAMIAANNPPAFQKMLDDPKTERKIILKAAIKKEIIVVNAQLNSLCWADNESVVISTAAPGLDVIDDFANKSFSSKGEESYLAIRNMLNADDKQTVVSTVKTAPIVNVGGETNEELLELIRDAVGKGIITIGKSRVWWTFMEKGYRTEDGMMRGLRDDASVLNALKTQIAKQLVEA